MSVTARHAGVISTTTPAVHRFVRVALGVPLLCIAGAYVWLAVAHHAIWLADVVVHESGRYTLTQTVFYFSHFLREIPIDIVMALFCAAAWDEACSAPAARVASAPRSVALLGAAAAIGIAAFAAVAATAGAQSALSDLLQYRTRDDVTAYGSHWHYHCASTIWFAAASRLAVCFTGAVAGTATNPRAPAQRLQIYGWLAIAGLSLIFGVSPLAFTSGLYTGHQARELMNHVPITMMLVFGVLAAVSGTPATAADLRPSCFQRLLAVIKQSPWWRTALAFAIPLVLAAVTIIDDPQDEAQLSNGLSGVIAGHVFEHVLDYVFTLLFAIGAAGLVRSRRPAVTAR